MKRYLALPIVTTAAAAAVLGGCSSAGDSDHDGHSAGGSSGSSAMATMPSSPAAAAATGPHNDADATFARDMITHHRQAVEMADMALSRSKNAGLVGLAKQIKAAQAPEIAKMSAWLEGWNQPVPTGSSMDHMDGTNHSGMSMPGMMSDTDMAALGKATGTAFDRLWLTMMTEHHRGAVSMSKTELAEGKNGDAQALATSIVSTQSAEISTMATLLAAL